MSNFYDLETDLEVEDVVSSDEDAYEEEYEEITDFGDYNAADADARWGSMDFDQLVVEMEGLVSRGKRFFFSKTKRVVDGKDIAMLAEYIQSRFPDEIVTANDIISREATIINDATAKSNSIIASARKQETEISNSAKTYYSETIKKAQDDAAKIIARAQAQAEEMVQEHNITRMARERSEQIKLATEQETQAMIAKTTEDCEELKARAKEWTVGIVEGARDFVTNGLAGYQNVAMQSLDNINAVNKQFQSEYSVQVRNLGLDSNN